MELEIIGAPSSAGAYGVGQERAPSALREAGLIRALTSAGHHVVDTEDMATACFAPDPTNRRAQNLDLVVDVARQVATRVRRAIQQARTALVLGGDCTVTLGVIDGLRQSGRDPAVAYLDGDLDVSTPATTTSGVLDAMGVAHMLGWEGTAPQLAGLAGTSPMLQGRELALIGHEQDDDDAVLHRQLEQRGVHRFPAAELRDDPVDVGLRVRRALPADTSLVAHLDVDAIDSIDCPLAHFPHFNTGAPLQDVAACLTTLCADPRLTALVLTEVNPANDPDHIHLPRLVGAIGQALPAPKPRAAPRRSR